MDIQITVDNSSANSLYRWLAADPEVRRNATLSLPSGGDPGAMGGALDVVNVVLSNTIAFSSLMVAIASWRASRPRQTTIEIKRDGVEVPLEPDAR